MCFLKKGSFQGKIDLSYHLVLSWSGMETQKNTNNCDSKNNNEGSEPLSILELYIPWRKKNKNNKKVFFS